jgi:hypothetical protein
MQAFCVRESERVLHLFGQVPGQVNPENHGKPSLHVSVREELCEPVFRHDRTQLYMSKVVVA